MRAIALVGVRVVGVTPFAVLKGFQKVIDIIRRSPGAGHGQKEFPDMTRIDVRNDGNTMLIMQKAKRIVDLLFIVPDGSGRQLTGLTMENELITDI